MFIAALFTTAKRNNLSVHQQMMDKEDVARAHTHTHTCARTYSTHITRVHTQHTYNTHAHARTHTMEYYSVIKRMKTTPSAATWTHLESTMLSETGQTEKEKIIYKETFQKTTTKN